MRSLRFHAFCFTIVARCMVALNLISVLLGLVSASTGASRSSSKSTTSTGSGRGALLYTPVTAGASVGASAELGSDDLVELGLAEAGDSAGGEGILRMLLGITCANGR